MSRRLEKIMKTNYCINLPKKSSAKHPIRFALLFLANLCNNLFYILHRKFLICFAQLHFLANLSNTLFYILHMIFFIRFALRFLANVSNSLSYII